MSRIAAVTIAGLGLLVAAPSAAPSEPAPLPLPHLRIGDTVVPLSRFVVTSTTCLLEPTRPGGCVVGDGVVPTRVRIRDRVQLPFRGTVTVGLGADTESVEITFGRPGRQPVARFGPLRPVVWPVAASGAYLLFIEIVSRDDRKRSDITYAVPVYAPRR